MLLVMGLFVVVVIVVVGVVTAMDDVDVDVVYIVRGNSAFCLVALWMH